MTVLKIQQLYEKTVVASPLGEIGHSCGLECVTLRAMSAKTDGLGSSRLVRVARYSQHETQEYDHAADDLGCTNDWLAPASWAALSASSRLQAIGGIRNSTEVCFLYC